MIVRQAVKRSREKNKKQADASRIRVADLKYRNEALKTKIDEKNKQILVLKDLFVQTALGKAINKDQLTQLLTDDDSGPCGSGFSGSGPSGSGPSTSRPSGSGPSTSRPSGSGPSGSRQSTK